MTYAPKELLDLQTYWRAQKGVSLGIVGDVSHSVRGVSYHLGRSQLKLTAYSRQTARDRAGLTEAASAIDLGRLDGGLTQLREFSRWFAQQCFDENPAYRDVREVIFWSTVRNRVIGWSDLSGPKWLNDYGNLSHKTHTHISFYRDSQSRDKTALFKPYFAPPPVTGGDVPTLSSYLPGYECTVKKTANIRVSPHLNATIIRVVSTPEHWAITGWVKGDVDPEGGSDQWVTRWHANRWEYTAKSNLSAGPTAPVGDCTDEVAAATLAGAQAEWDRQQVGATVDVRLLDRPK